MVPIFIIYFFKTSDQGDIKTTTKCNLKYIEKFQFK